MRQPKTEQEVINNMLYAAYGCMKVADNPFVVQLHETLQKHPATKYVNIGVLFGSFYKLERDPKRDKAVGLALVSAAQARLTATHYTLEILDLIAHNMGMEPNVLEMLPTLEDLGPTKPLTRQGVKSV